MKLFSWLGAQCEQKKTLLLGRKWQISPKFHHLKRNKLYDSQTSTRWHCFQSITIHSPEFNFIPFFFLLFQHTEEKRPWWEHKGTPPAGITLPFSFVCSVCSHVCISIMFQQNKSHLLRPERCLLYLFESGCVYVCVTLYSCTTPFCSSSGGGCQETTTAVPLLPLSVTVTLRGGALGAFGETQKKEKITFVHSSSECTYSHMLLSFRDLLPSESKADVRTND